MQPVGRTRFGTVPPVLIKEHSQKRMTAITTTNPSSSRSFDSIALENASCSEVSASPRRCSSDHYSRAFAQKQSVPSNRMRSENGLACCSHTLLTTMGSMAVLQHGRADAGARICGHDQTRPRNASRNGSNFMERKLLTNVNAKSDGKRPRPDEKDTPPICAVMFAPLP